MNKNGTKKELLEYIEMIEKNNQALEQRVAQQYVNFIKQMAECDKREKNILP